MLDVLSVNEPSEVQVITDLMDLAHSQHGNDLIAFYVWLHWVKRGKDVEAKRC